jgi:hypothetical protein
MLVDEYRLSLGILMHVKYIYKLCSLLYHIHLYLIVCGSPGHLFH